MLFRSLERTVGASAARVIADEASWSALFTKAMSEGTMRYSYVSSGLARTCRTASRPRLRIESYSRRQLAANVGKNLSMTSAPKMTFLGRRARASAALIRPGGDITSTKNTATTGNVGEPGHDSQDWDQGHEGHGQEAQGRQEGAFEGTTDRKSVV